MIQRQGDGFPLDRSRVAYLRYLRRERQQSPRSEADADHVKVKTEMLQLRLMEKRRELAGLSVQAQSSGRFAHDQDQRERSALDVVAGGTVNWLWSSVSSANLSSSSV